MPVLPRAARGPRPWIKPPRLRTLEEVSERHASWLELFFDIVFVVAIAELAHELVVDHSPAGFARFGGLFLPVFIAWQGFMAYADRFDTDDVVFRAVMLMAMLAIAALAVQVPDVVHGDSTGFAVAYISLRSLMVGLYVRSYRHVPEARPLIRRYGGGYSIGIALWVASLALDEPARYVLWAVALAFEYSLPPLSRRLHTIIPADAGHMPERFGLFTIIVLGESVVAVALGTADSEWHVASAASAALGFVAVAALWWVYFEVEGPEVRREPGAILVFAYVHIPLLAALTAVAAGVNILIDQSAADHLDTGGRVALAGGAAVYLACLTMAQSTSRPVRGIAAARAATAVALGVLLFLGTLMAPTAFAAALAALLVGLVVAEVALGHAFAQPAGTDEVDPDVRVRDSG
jgi:low temperature requirement protein LtrA